MVLNEQDMAKVRLEPEEYLTGVVEQVVSEDEAAQLIEQADRELGPLVKEQEQPSEDSTQESTEESPEESSEQISLDEQSESESAEQPEVEQPEVEQRQAEEGQNYE